MSAQSSIAIGLSAVIIALEADSPCVLTIVHQDDDRGNDDHKNRIPDATGLPFGPLDPVNHRTFELGLRSWVSQQTGFALGYVEQLYTFGDQGRMLPRASAEHDDVRHISVGYLALTDAARPTGGFDARWRSWYAFFPWEDHRQGRPAMIDDQIAPALYRWAAEKPGEGRLSRARLAFGLDGQSWSDSRVLLRYELLYEAGLVVECSRDHGGHAAPVPPLPGSAMLSDHRRILATAIDRLRSKLRYRPVVFELLPERFTLSHLQKTVEAILGQPLHKQNFRRALEKTLLVIGTGEFDHTTGGRPAELYRFRREDWRQQMAPGVQTPLQSPG